MVLAPIVRIGIGVIAKKVLTPDEQAEENERGLSTFVSSSAISRISWKNETITVVFRRDGSSHDYPGSRELYQDFVSAPSIGRYFNAHIR